MKSKRYLWLGGSLMAVMSSLHAAEITVTADITANTTWISDNVYILDKSIFVKNGATLTIEPGTTVLGTQNAGNNTYGSLVVARGSKLMAEGTAEAPIVFTAKQEYDANLTVDPSDDLDPAAGDGGYWGGIILLGSAPINFYTGPTTNANENSIEGFPAGSSADLLYGGNNPTDNSGVLKYVSIRFGGYVYASNREINGLTMGGVGSGTTIENVEVVSNTDDGVEIFGGTVNTKRIAVAFCQDDSFDLDEGHQGYHQFWFAIQNATGTLGDRGGEWDGGNGSTVTGTPYTTATIYNATFIGDSPTAGGGNHAFFVDDNFAGQLHNSVVHEFSGVAVQDSGDGIGAAPNPLFQNVTWGTIAGGAGSLASVSGTGNSALGTNPLLRGIGRTGGLDPRPQAASTLLSSPLSAAPGGAPVGFYETVSYRGAFGETNWLDGWSYLSQKGYLADVKPEITVTADIIANTTWTSDNVYILDKSIFVKNGATLTIQPGTTVLGTQNVGNNTYGSLVVARGSKLMAEGTAEAPIVFTAKQEYDANLTVDPSDDLDPAAGDGGYWGGIILLGSAPINFYTGPTTNANENSIEGFPAGSSADLLYGGNNPTDNSGVLKYVSIRFGGYVYASNREINGLTMGGVGSGTTIENVEVVSNTDDGVEIFGGTVNTKRIAVAFCQDDSFDLDEGHQGYHQFWFAIQNASGTLGDRGGEWDGGNGSTVTGTPYTTATIYNATFIGDSAVAGGGNHAFYVDDNFAGQLHNSVVHEFSGVAVQDSGDGIGAAPNPLFENVTWGTIASGAGSLASVSGTGNSALGTNPNLVGISRVANGGLDPRPNLASPLRTAPLSAAPVGAPAGFFETVSYRGAFGDSNWLNGWSYLAQEGYLSGYPDAGGSGGSFADADGDGVSDALENANTALG
jgi:trimeric autotransporter adhesin